MSDTSPQKKRGKKLVGYFCHAISLHLIAKMAYDRMSDVKDDLEGTKDDALVAVLFSAAALEAFITQFALFGEMVASTPTRRGCNCMCWRTTWATSCAGWRCRRV